MFQAEAPPARSLWLGCSSYEMQSESGFACLLVWFVCFARQRCLLLLSGPSRFTLHLHATSHTAVLVTLSCSVLWVVSHLISHQQLHFDPPPPYNQDIIDIQINMNEFFMQDAWRAFRLEDVELSLTSVLVGVI